MVKSTILPRRHLPGHHDEPTPRLIREQRSCLTRMSHRLSPDGAGFSGLHALSPNGAATIA